MLSVQPYQDRASKRLCIGRDILLLNNLRSVLLNRLFFRTTRWLDRCIKAHKKPDKQNLFPIVQGGLDAKLRTESAKQLIERDVAGFAIGGLR